MSFFIQALRNLKPTAKVIIVGDDAYENIEWLDTEQTKPTEAEITAEITRLQTEYVSQEYARLRKAAYDLLNQFEMQFDDQLNGTTTWVEAINEIKARHPKP